MTRAFFRRPVRRTRSGRYTLTITDDERGILRHLAPQLQVALSDPDAPGLRRLFPPAYADAADADKQDEYARFTQTELAERHSAALEILQRTADATDLSAEELDAWARALNQLRLAIGTRLDVSEAEDPGLADDPEHQLYYFLGYLQECVIDALSGQD